MQHFKLVLAAALSVSMIACSSETPSTSNSDLSSSEELETSALNFVSSETRTYYSDSVPLPVNGESVVDFSRGFNFPGGEFQIKMLACSEWASAFINASSNPGLRLCYEKVGGKIVVDEWLPNATPSAGFSRTNIGKFLCTKRIETKGRNSNLKCLVKKFN